MTTRIYCVIILAWRRRLLLVRNCVATDTVTATSDDEATGRAVKIAEEVFPASEGWRYKTRIVRINDETVTEAYLSLQSERANSTEPRGSWSILFTPEPGDILGARQRVLCSILPKTVTGDVSKIAAISLSRRNEPLRNIPFERNHDVLKILPGGILQYGDLFHVTLSSREPWGGCEIHGEKQ